jgi:hypothetical protein
MLASSPMHLLRAAVFAPILLLSSRAGGGEDEVDGAPSGIVSFFVGETCPPGWQPAADAAGRLIVGVSDPAMVGLVAGTPLGDKEDRVHTHVWTGTLNLGSKNVAGADGGNNQGAAARAYELSGFTGPAPSGLPFQQLLACEKP